MPVVLGDDVERCADVVRPMIALYIGGMGAKGANFHFDVFARMGYEDVRAGPGAVPRRAQGGGRAAVPLAMVEDVALVGPAEKIRDELRARGGTPASRRCSSGPGDALPSYAELILG